MQGKKNIITLHRLFRPVAALCLVLMLVIPCVAGERCPVSLLRGVVSLEVPEGLSPLAPDLRKAKFPDLPPDAGDVLASRDGSATVAAYSPETPFPDDVATARPVLSMEMHEIYPDARWLRDELVMVDGRFCVRFEFETTAPDGPIHNDMLVLSHEGRMLIIAVSAGGASRETWMQHSEEILQSLRLISPGAAR